MRTSASTEEPGRIRLRTRLRPALRLRFDSDGRDWPNGEASRFVAAGGLTWHVQILGSGPPLLLVHGTGASTHSFADLAPRLARRFRVIAFDLPGHGFTGPLPSAQCTLPGMAAAVRGLLDALDCRPAVAVGHSAGAAILLRMCLDGAIEPRVVVSLNGALAGFGGLVGRVFSPLAKLLAVNPLVPRLFARRAQNQAVMERLVRQTGSAVPARSAELYARLARDPDHVAAALAMMAGWDLDALRRDFGRLRTPVVLVAGARDGMVPADQVFAVASRIPLSRVVVLRGLGHLAHEEDPEAVAAIIEEAAGEHGIGGEVSPS
jgi:magnesium chelatase accessory protein